MTRLTNPELCTMFRALMTGKATDELDNVAHTLNKRYGTTIEVDELLSLTKPWRSELWLAFQAIEERLDPLGVETRRRERIAGKDNE